MNRKDQVSQENGEKRGAAEADRAGFLQVLSGPSGIQHTASLANLSFW